MSQPVPARTVLGALLSVTGVGLAGVGGVMLLQGSAYAEPTDQVYVCKYKTAPDPGDEILKPGKNPIVVAVSTLDLSTWVGTFPWQFADGQYTSVAIGYAGGENPVLTEDDCVAPRTDPTDVPTTDVPTTDVPTTDVPTTDVPTTDVPTTDVPTTDVPTTDVPTTDVPTMPVAGVIDTTAPPEETPTTTPTPTASPAALASVPKAVAAGAAGPRLATSDRTPAEGLALGAGGGLLAVLGAALALGGRQPRGSHRV